MERDSWRWRTASPSPVVSGAHSSAVGSQSVTGVMVSPRATKRASIPCSNPAVTGQIPSAPADRASSRGKAAKIHPHGTYSPRLETRSETLERGRRSRPDESDAPLGHAAPRSSVRRLRRPLPQVAGFDTVIGRGEDPLPITQEEKEKLADRVVALLRAENPKASLDALEARVAAGDEGKDGMNSAVLAITTAILRRGIG